MDVILDVDPGVDDALAILLALSSPELNVRAVSVVCGNVPLDVGTDNALRVLNLAGRNDIPVFTGADRPLVRSPVYATQVHGSTGLGRADLPLPERTVEDRAPAAIVDMIGRQPGELTVIAVGPLTNLAHAERLSPGILDKAREVIVMGGTVCEPGNASPTAEFNFYADPEAAAEVIAASERLTIVPLDVTHRVGIGEAEIEATIRLVDSPRCEFFSDATEVVVQHGAEHGGYAGVYLHDPAAVAYAIEAGLFRCETLYASVETRGAFTSGQLVVDRRVGIPESGRVGRLAKVAMGVDAERLLTMFKTRVLGIEGGG